MMSDAHNIEDIVVQSEASKVPLHQVLINMYILFVYTYKNMYIALKYLLGANKYECTVCICIHINIFVLCLNIYSSMYCRRPWSSRGM
jgi:hypothetical protein